MKCKIYKVVLSAAILIVLFTGCNQLPEGANDSGFITTDFETVKKIVVSLPVNGDIYEPGESVQVKWSSSFSNISNIDIYLYKKTALRKTLAQNLVNQGSYTWLIPNVIVNSVHYKIKVVNSNNREEFNYSGRFQILKTNNNDFSFQGKINPNANEDLTEIEEYTDQDNSKEELTLLIH